MEYFITSLSILIVSGLGFITYKHPQTGRTLVSVLLGIAALFYVVVNAYYYGKDRGYYESMAATRISQYKRKVHNYDLDSLQSAIKPDSFSKFLQKEKEYSADDWKAIQSERQFTDSIYNHITQSQKISNDSQASLNMYAYLGAIISFTLLILSIVFEQMHSHNSQTVPKGISKKK